MNGTHSYERKIYMPYVWREVLRAWRLLLILALIGALAGGAYGAISYRQEKREWESGQMEESGEAAESVREIRASVYERALDEMYEKRTSRMEYLSQSLLSSLNPYAVPTAHAVLRVDLAGENPGEAESEILRSRLVSSYERFVRYEYSWPEECAASELSPIYYQELLKVSSDDMAGEIHIAMRHTDEAEAERLLGVLLAACEARDHAESEIDRDFTVTGGSIRVSVERDSTLDSYAETQVNLMNSIDSSISTYEGYLRRLNSGGSGAKPSPKSILKFLVLGLIGAAFAGAALLVIWRILGDRLLGAEEMKATFGLPVLCFSNRKREKRALKGVDLLIEKIGAGKPARKRQADPFRTAASLLRHRLPGGGSVRVVGELSGKSLEAVAERLKGTLGEKSKIICEVLPAGEDIPADTAGLILAAEEERTSCRAVRDILALAEEADIPVILCLMQS